MRKPAESGLPDGKRQREMREEIIGRLDQIIDGWAPKFAELSPELKDVSEAALETLRQSRGELSEIIFPRKDRRVGEYYRTLFDKTEELLKIRVQTSYAGDKKIQSPVNVVLAAVRAWSALD